MKKKYLMSIVGMFLLSSMAFSSALLKDAYKESHSVIVAQLIKVEEVDKLSRGKLRPYVNYTFEIVDVLHSQDGEVLKPKDTVVYSHARYLKFKLSKLREKFKENKTALIFVGKLQGKNIILKSSDMVFEVVSDSLKDPGEFERIFSEDITA